MSDQPEYPTAWAYEQACEALRATKAERDRLRAEVIEWKLAVAAREADMDKDALTVIRERDRLQKALYAAWTIIANVSEGDWTKQTDEWVKATERWRDEDFHPSLDRGGGSP